MFSCIRKSKAQAVSHDSCLTRVEVNDGGLGVVVPGFGTTIEIVTKQDSSYLPGKSVRISPSCSGTFKAQFKQDGVEFGIRINNENCQRDVAVGMTVHGQAFSVTVKGGREILLKTLPEIPGGQKLYFIKTDSAEGRKCLKEFRSRHGVSKSKAVSLVSKIEFQMKMGPRKLFVKFRYNDQEFDTMELTEFDTVEELRDLAGEKFFPDYPHPICKFDGETLFDDDLYLNQHRLYQSPEPIVIEVEKFNPPSPPLRSPSSDVDPTWIPCIRMLGLSGSSRQSFRTEFFLGDRNIKIEDFAIRLTPAERKYNIL